MSERGWSVCASSQVKGREAKGNGDKRNFSSSFFLYCSFIGGCLDPNRPSSRLVSLVFSSFPSRETVRHTERAGWGPGPCQRCCSEGLPFFFLFLVFPIRMILRCLRDPDRVPVETSYLWPSEPRHRAPSHLVCGTYIMASETLALARQHLSRANHCGKFPRLR